MAEDRQALSLRQLADLILALPEDDQAKLAFYHLVDDAGDQRGLRIYGLIACHGNDPVIDGENHSV